MISSSSWPLDDIENCLDSSEIASLISYSDYINNPDSIKLENKQQD